MNRSNVVLLDVTTGETRDAVLIDRVDSVLARKAEDSWQTFLAAARAEAAARGAPLEKLDHEHWKWAAKVESTERLLPYPTLGIECDEQMQGLMLLETDGHFSKLSAGSSTPLVYINLLATAPWNLPDVIGVPRYRGAGVTLFHAAIHASVELEFKGRLGLHALPKSEAFYDKQGMTCLGPDPLKQGLKYYEITADQARKLIE